MEGKKYLDKVLLELRKESEKSKEPVLISEKCDVKKIAIYENDAYMMIPIEWQSMNPVWRCAKYNRSYRPEVIITDAHGDATITFSDVGKMDRLVGIRQCCMQLKNDMQEIWNQLVFYDSGAIKAGKKDVEWMDYKMFCIDSELYCLLFLFDVKNHLIMGNFHCSFSIYNRWKPQILMLLETIEEV